MSDLSYNPNSGDFSNKIPMKQVEKLSYLNSIEDLYRYKGDSSIGTYYPVRVLPSMSINKDAEWPVVMPAGTIVSIVSIKDARAYTSDDEVAGIRTDGMVYVSQGMDGSKLEKNINFLYPKDVAGLIVPANGGVSQDDNYSNVCGENGILTLSGEIAAASSPVYTRPINAPVGIVDHSVHADLRYRYLNYDAPGSGMGVSISRNGIITIPYVGIYGSGDRAVVRNAIRTAVDSKHQYACFSHADESQVNTLMETGNTVAPDKIGKFKEAFGLTDSRQIFGTILETRNRVPWNLDEIIDSFPGSGMKGTDTGGLTARLYHFITSILKQPGIKDSSYAADKNNVKKVLYEPLATNTANVTIVMGQMDISFGIYF